MITKEQLKAAMPSISLANLESYIQPLNDTVDRFQINSVERLCMFLSNVAHESSCLAYTQENLKYSAQRLTEVFPSVFNFNKGKNPAPYHYQPEKIANCIYANRMGNGPESSGDGYKYRGRGPIEITGKDNYSQLTKDLGVDFVSHPELLEGPVYGMLAAGWYWSKAGCNIYADNKDFDGCCDAINIGRKTKTLGDSVGYADRVRYYNLAKSIFQL